MKSLQPQLLKALFFAGLATSLSTPLAIAAEPSVAEPPVLRVTVNSAADGPIVADGEMTLREAIALSNGTLALDQLTATEQAQVARLAASDRPVIAFNLTAAQTIELTELLPEIARPGLLIDGTTQPGYETETSEAIAPAPVVAITAAADAGVFRGLAVVADNVTIRGLSLYGFTTQNWGNEAVLPADILITHRLPPPNIQEHQPPNDAAPFYDENLPPRGVVVEQNWLGLPPTGEQPETASAFGVYVFHGVETRVRQNWIGGHSGSGVITSVRASGLEIAENRFTDNGSLGMPDAIRLEGEVAGTQIRQNEIERSYGSGIFLFKTSGAVTIAANQLIGNGQGLEQAAVYLMGNEHQVIDNLVREQNGPGVVVAAYPESDRNQILNNRFEAINGLSIDLTARRQAGETHFQRGDGPNPPRNSRNRRLDTANDAIDAPRFLSREFFLMNGQVAIAGQADPNAQITLYRVLETSSQYGPLNQPLAEVQADEAGHFEVVLTSLQSGDTVSAIASHPEYGTSEPARNTKILTLSDASAAASTSPTNSPIH
ncbi:MAG: right-handed parallel beta-helix repeat-containing protein [Leptolyngbya sp. SIO4C5]|nr:right-handed parallel beta-helix repeat-containing protein [Leptolyngbya sp. SIO4C5]